MYVNIIDSYRKVIAIADKELVGKRFEEGSKQLEVKKSFYKGEEEKTYSPDEVKHLIERWIIEDATFNIVGEKAVRVALEVGVIDEEGIGRIGDVPYALVLL